MARSRTPSLGRWFAVSVLLHGIVGVGVWDSRPVPTPSSPAADRIVVTLVEAKGDAPEPPAVSSGPPPPPRPPEAVPPPKPRPKAVVPEARPPVPSPSEPTVVASVVVDTPVPTESLLVENPSAATEPERASDGGEAAEPSESQEAESESTDDRLRRYVEAVRSRVDSKKRYPAMARRRSEEGLVVARLSVTANGRLEELDLDGRGPLLLRRATRAAIEAAAPFGVPPLGAVVIEIPVRWRIQN